MKGSIGQLASAVHHRAQRITNEKLSHININKGLHYFFYVISLNEGFSQDDLSKRVDINKPTTAKAVKHLISKGYIKRVKNRFDSTVEHLYLTKAGKDIAEMVQGVYHENREIAKQGLSDDEEKQLTHLLQKVLDNLLDEHGKLFSDELLDE